MCKVQRRVNAPADWGIEPVPPEQRILSGFDLGVLWGDFGVGLLVLVTGALLVPGLGLGAAAVAIVAGSILGSLLLALAGIAGADHGVPTMVLFRPVLGVRGSWVPSALNTLQLLGWTAVEFWAISLVADIVSQRVFGFSARSLWLMVTAVICTGLALWGPVAVTRVWMERFSAWTTGGICVALTVIVLAGGRLGAVSSARVTGGFPSFGSALDLVIAMPVSWLPLVADYNRFARRPRAAFGGTFIGFVVANVWLFMLGAVLVLATNASPTPGGIAVGVLAIAGSSLAGVLFLVGLLAGETDEAFADMYSGALSLQNVFPRVPVKTWTFAIAGVATILARFLSIAGYESFLFLIGSIFVPLFGVLAADYFVSRRRRIEPLDLYDGGGSYWFRLGVRLETLVPWLVGFAVYHWIAPSGPGWWVETVGAVVGSPLSQRVGWLPASLPSFVIAFLATLLVLPRHSDPEGKVKVGPASAEVYHPGGLPSEVNE